MNKRSVFVENINEEKENEIDKYLRELQKLNSRYCNMISEIVNETNRQYLKKYEFEIGLFAKIQLAIESCIYLLKSGYYGTSNAMYRQIYEFILWIKVSKTVNGEDLENLSKYFYKPHLKINPDNIITIPKKEGVNKKDTVVQYIKNNFSIEINDGYEKGVTTKSVYNVLEYYYSELCEYTHASQYAQQYFFETNDEFYEAMKSSILNLVILVESTFYLFDKFFSDFIYENHSHLNFFQKNDWDVTIYENLEKITKLLNLVDPNSINKETYQKVILCSDWQLKV